jgi:hypothetical protein
MAAATGSSRAALQPQLLCAYLQPVTSPSHRPSPPPPDCAGGYAASFRGGPCRKCKKGKYAPRNNIGTKDWVSGPAGCSCWARPGPCPGPTRGRAQPTRRPGPCRDMQPQIPLPQCLCAARAQPLTRFPSPSCDRSAPARIAQRTPPSTAGEASAWPTRVTMGTASSAPRITTARSAPPGSGRWGSSKGKFPPRSAAFLAGVLLAAVAAVCAARGAPRLPWRVPTG